MVRCCSRDNHVWLDHIQSPSSHLTLLSFCLALQEQFDHVLDAAVAATLLEADTAAELRAAAAGSPAAAGERGGSVSGIAAVNGAVPSPTAAAANGVGIGGSGVPAFKAAMATALKEFFNSADVQEVAARSAADIAALLCCAVLCGISLLLLLLLLMATDGN